MQDLNKRTREIVAEREYITIATSSSDGQPWNSPVYSAFDEDYVFYWGSHIESQHSKNIAENNKVFLVIYDSTAPAGKGEGVYVQAVAERVTDPAEKDKAHKLIQDRRPSFYWRRDEFDEPTPLSLYKAVPQKIWMNGEGSKDGHYIDTRLEVHP